MAQNSLVVTNSNCVGCNKCISVCSCVGATVAKQTEDGKNVINELAMIRLNAPVKQIIGEDKGYFFENIEDYFKLIEKLDTYLHKSISVKTFLEALLKVRKIEYYDEPDYHPEDWE